LFLRSCASDIRKLVCEIAYPPCGTTDSSVPALPPVSSCVAIATNCVPATMQADIKAVILSYIQGSFTVCSAFLSLLSQLTVCSTSPTPRPSLRVKRAAIVMIFTRHLLPTRQHLLLIPPSHSQGALSCRNPTLKVCSASIPTATRTSPIPLVGSPLVILTLSSKSSPKESVPRQLQPNLPIASLVPKAFSNPFANLRFLSPIPPVLILFVKAHAMIWLIFVEVRNLDNFAQLLPVGNVSPSNKLVREVPYSLPKPFVSFSLNLRL